MKRPWSEDLRHFALIYGCWNNNMDRDTKNETTTKYSYIFKVNIDNYFLELNGYFIQITRKDFFPSAIEPWKNL